MGNGVVGGLPVGAGPVDRIAAKAANDLDINGTSQPCRIGEQHMRQRHSGPQPEQM